MHKRANISTCLALLLACVSLAACTGPPPITRGFELRALNAPAPDGALHLDALFAPRESSFKILRGQHAGQTLHLTITRDGDRATITRSLEDGTVLNEQHVRVRKNTAIETSFKNHERNVIVELKPKQTLWPIDGLTKHMRIRLPRLDNPSKLKERGTATSITTIESIDLIETPSGPLEAVRVRTVFESQLRAASATRTTDRWYTNELGLVAERWDETVTAFGITIERSERTIVLRTSKKTE